MTTLCAGAPREVKPSAGETSGKLSGDHATIYRNDQYLSGALSANKQIAPKTWGARVEWMPFDVVVIVETSLDCGM